METLPAQPAIRDLLAWAESRLADTATPRLDSQVLLCHCLERDRSHLYAWPERCPDPDRTRRFRELVDRRAAGDPVAHLTGTREFWSLAFEITPDTLVPRPETERLVESALEHLPADRPGHVLDLGTGSGAVALAIATERPKALIIGTDRSEQALRVAHRNARRLGIGNTIWLCGDWYAPVTGRFDMIVSNPPYVAPDDPHLTTPELQSEPASALVAGRQGLADIEAIIAGGRRHLRAGGWLMVEHGHDQGPVVADMLHLAGYERVGGERDLGGRSRVSYGKQPGDRGT